MDKEILIRLANPASIVVLASSIFSFTIISLPSKAHTAFDKLKDFESWTSFEKDTYANNR